MTLAGGVLDLLQLGAALMGVYAFIHAALQRPDAYTAVDKLTKPVWLVILGCATGIGLLMGPPVGAAITICAAGVYLVDVRPKILDIQGKSR
jgi:4-amino-4-deoxy-L-arabinose transferase-like glycosyltransferase